MPTLDARCDFDEFLAMVPEGTKADLLDGRVVYAEPETHRQNQLVGFLGTLWGMFLSARGVGGEVYLHRFTTRLGPWDACDPDLMYVAPSKLALINERYLDEAPTVAVEIVSRDSRQRDWVDKRMKYEAADVEEYWIIDPIQRRCEFLRRQENGRYDVVPLEKNRIFRSTAIPGFWLNIEWLLATPLPNDYQCLQELLADE
jgi:Uma2 family endonuclease